MKALRLAVSAWVRLLGLGVALALPNGVEAQILSPGKLASAHADLEGIRSCTACHDLGKRGVSAEKCLACHEPIAKRVASGSGYHATVPEGACSDCHKDHLGTDFDLMRLDEASFDHGLTGFELRLGHAGVACRDCHRPSRIADADVLAFVEGGGGADRTFLGLSPSCEGCHGEESPHGAQLGGRSCAECHDEADWKKPTRFDHATAAFHLEGRHRQVACADCHRTGPDGTVFRPIAFRSCADCHSDPHSGGMKGECALCHRTTGWTQLAAGSLEGRFDHGSTAFPLRGAHASADCTACHRQGRPPQSELIHVRYQAGTAGTAYPRPVHVTCGSCHADRHVLPAGGSTKLAACDACHVEAGWTPSSYSLAEHDADSGFPLTGAHAVTPCFACHQAQGPGQGRFRLDLTATTCADCHTPESDRHDSYDGLACETCHRTETFEQVAFDHAAVTGGAEVRPCATCHEADDPHGGQFAGRDCSSCHDTAAFAIAAFDHSRTAFPLDGAHRSAPCAACHRAEEGSDAAVIRYTPLGTACTDCHGGDR